MNTGEVCDRDPVEAALFVVWTFAGPLTFCGHHAREYEERIILAGFRIRELAGPIPYGLDLESERVRLTRAYAPQARG